MVDLDLAEDEPFATISTCIAAGETFHVHYNGTEVTTDCTISIESADGVRRVVTRESGAWKLGTITGYTSIDGDDPDDEDWDDGVVIPIVEWETIPTSP
jgi:type 1 fimbria pilin